MVVFCNANCIYYVITFLRISIRCYFTKLIIINGTAYAFERKSAQDGMDLFDNPGIIPANVATVTLNIIQKELRPKLSQIQEQFSKTKHLFLSDEDLTLVKKQMANCDKRLNELQVKATNAESLI